MSGPRGVRTEFADIFDTRGRAGAMTRLPETAGGHQVLSGCPRVTIAAEQRFHRHFQREAIAAADVRKPLRCRTSLRGLRKAGLPQD
jgi:hypothetical protein